MAPSLAAQFKSSGTELRRAISFTSFISAFFLIRLALLFWFPPTPCFVKLWPAQYTSQASSVFLLRRQCIAHIPTTHHARTFRISLSMEDSGGAFSDCIPEDGPMWSICGGSSCAVMSVLTERQQAAASQYTGPNSHSMMVHLYLCDSCSFISRLLF